MGNNNNKGSGIFLGVIGVATLLVAIIGATFAFFGANIGSEEGAVTVKSASLSLGYADITTGLKTNLIPAEYWIAEYAANEQPTADEAAEDYTGKLQCIDQNGNEVCGVYTFTIGNPSFTTSQDLYGSIKVVSNEFTDLYFSIYDELGEQVVEPTAFSTADENGTIALDELNQRLLPSSLDDTDADGVANTEGFDSTKPGTYTSINDMTLETNKGKENNVRTYKMVIWIEETMTNQTETNSGKSFAASVNFTTASDKSGVTGVIAAAQKPTGGADNPDGSNYPAA